MIITIDTTIDTIEAKDIYSDSDLNMLEAIRKVRFNETEATVLQDIHLETLKKVIHYLRSLSHADPWDANMGGTPHTIQQIKLVRAITDMGLKEAKDFVESA